MLKHNNHRYINDSNGTFCETCQVWVFKYKWVYPPYNNKKNAKFVHEQERIYKKNSLENEK